MNQAAIAAGCAAFRDDAWFRECTAKIIRTRERVKKELSVLGFTFPDSKANFLFVTHPVLPARELFARLRRSNILVRYFDRPGIDNYLRVTIGTDDEMDALISFLKREVEAL
jgi:histidinol-phosphate aminotransferase